MAEITLTTSGTALTLTASGQSLTFETAGELNAAANVGGGDAEVFRDKVGAVLNFRTVSGTGGIVVTENGDVVEISGATLGTGDVIGPGAATDEAIARFDGVTGKLIQNSLVKINDAGLMTLPGGQGIITTSGTISVLANGTLVLGGGGANAFNINNPSTITSRNANPFTMESVVADSASAVGFSFRPTLLDKDTFTLGALHTEWVDAAGDTIMSLEPDGDLIVRELRSTGGNGVQGAVVNATTVLLVGNFTAMQRITSTLTLLNNVSDSATAVNFTHKSTILDKDSFTAGALHSEWTDAGNDIIMSLTPRGDLSLREGLTLGDNGSGFTQLDIQSVGANSAEILFNTNQFKISQSSGISGLQITRGDGGVKRSAFFGRTTGDVTFGDGTEGILTWNGATGDVVLGTDGTIRIDGDINHDGSNVGFYGTAPAAQSAAYTRNAVVVEDRTLLASASATTINNNNVLAALIADLQSRGFIG